MATLSQRLTERGRPGVRAQLEHPTVAGIARGDLPDEVFRDWLEQDYLLLLDYVRVFCRLGWQPPAADLGHLGDLVDLAHSTMHEELSLHRGLAAEFGADLAGARAGPDCIAYTAFLLDAAADYGRGLAALLPCMWGYSTLGRRLAEDPPDEPRYARWVATYADPGFAALAGRCAAMLDDAAAAGLVGEASALVTFDQAMRHELAFWNARGPKGGRPARRADEAPGEWVHGMSRRTGWASR